jgi:riboflavin biosynthesis protein RibD
MRPDNHEPFMRHAIGLARQARWQTAPNPCVGAVLVQGEAIVAEGWHRAAGQPHAEVEALAQAKERGVDTRSCTLYVTLEPCNHHGKTPPCTQALLEAGIPRVVVGVPDQNPKAAGGIALLRQKGVQVTVGVLEQQCLDLVDDFLVWQTTPLPYTLVKLACTLDGRIATRTGHSQWISSAESRQRVHYYRKHAGAVLVGGKTFYQDNPRLTCRLSDNSAPQASPEPSAESSPLAVVVSSRLPDASASFHLVQHRAASTLFFTPVAKAASPKAEALRKLGMRVFGLPALSRPKSHSKQRNPTLRCELDLAEGLRLLREEFGCYHVLCEGGGSLALSLLESGLAHELELHMAPMIMADNEATPLFTGLSPDTVQEAFGLRLLGLDQCGPDLILSLKPARK